MTGSPQHFGLRGDGKQREGPAESCSDCSAGVKTDGDAADERSSGQAAGGGAREMPLTCSRAMANTTLAQKTMHETRSWKWVVLGAYGQSAGAGSFEMMRCNRQARVGICPTWGTWHAGTAQSEQDLLPASQKPLHDVQLERLPAPGCPSTAAPPAYKLAPTQKGVGPCLSLHRKVWNESSPGPK